MGASAAAPALRQVLLPGRHHVLTRFQARYLRALLDGGVEDLDGVPIAMAPAARVVVAVTSANHDNTRRNPVAGHRREAAVERFGVLEGLEVVVVPVVDTLPTPRFPEVVLTSVGLATGGPAPTPADTVVACSTPDVLEGYRALGFRVAGVELDVEPQPARPWQVVEALAAGDEGWRRLAHPASVSVLDRYGLVERIRLLFDDPVLSDEGGLTASRAYRPYAAAFDEAADRKWAALRDLVRPGRIVDVGCGTGALLERAAAEPRLRESDLFGIEVDRHLFAECEHRRAQGVFANPHTFFLRRNVLTGAAFPERSVDTVLSTALTHELLSYGDGVDEVRRFARAVFEQLVPGGVWLNSDVCGPDDGDREVLLRVRSDDGRDIDRATALDGLPPEEAAAAVAGLSTRGRLLQFARDFPRLARCRFAVEEVVHGTFRTTLRDAMEFLTRKDYVDSWLSECHERFCVLDGAGWRRLALAAGFEVDAATRTERNDWIVEHRLAPVASLEDAETGAALPWPATHVLLVARRPARPSP